MISRLLVANRGEIARRVFTTCRRLGIATVAVHSDADARLPFVAEADQAVRLPGDAPADTYLRGDLVIEAARRAGADAIHPGYGFLSENADFARAVLDAGLAWLGPPPKAIEAMGSKIEAKRLMAHAGVPVLEAQAEQRPSKPGQRAHGDAAHRGGDAGTAVGRGDTPAGTGSTRVGRYGTAERCRAPGLGHHVSPATGAWACMARLRIRTTSAWSVPPRTAGSRCRQPR